MFSMESIPRTAKQRTLLLLLNKREQFKAKIMQLLLLIVTINNVMIAILSPELCSVLFGFIRSLSFFPARNDNTIFPEVALV